VKVRDNIELHQMTKVASNAAYWKQRVGPAKTIQSRNQGVAIRSIILFMVLLLFCTCVADVFALDCSYIDEPSFFTANGIERLGKVNVVNNQYGRLFDTLLVLALKGRYSFDESESEIIAPSDLSAQYSNQSELKMLSLILYTHRQGFMSKSALVNVIGSSFINTTFFDGVLATSSATKQMFLAIIGACIIALPFLRRLKKVFGQARMC